MARVDLLGPDGPDSFGGQLQHQPNASPGPSGPPKEWYPTLPGNPAQSYQPYQPAPTPKAGYTNPSAPQPFSPSVPYPTPGTTTWTAPPGYKGPNYSGYPGSYGGAPGQFNFTDPNNRPPPMPLTGAAAAPFDVNAFGQAWLKSGGRTNQDFLNFYNQYPGAAASGWKIGGSHGGNLEGPGGKAYDMVIASGLGGQGASFADRALAGGAGGGNVFTDPATSQWETMLRQLSDRLNQPAMPQDYAPLVGYLRQYFQQLQGPAYTPAESDLLQTQAIDPLTRQRDAARQQTLQRLSARGIDPKSGVALGALRDVDRQYDQMATQQRSGFAANAVGLEKQQHQQAAGVGNALTQLETAKTQQDEQRALQSLNLMFQIPQLADSRLRAAQATLQPTNPAQLLSLFPQFGQLGLQQSGQDQQYWAQIGQLLARAFGGG